MIVLLWAAYAPASGCNVPRDVIAVEVDARPGSNGDDGEPASGAPSSGAGGAPGAAGGATGRTGGQPSDATSGGAIAVLDPLTNGGESGGSAGTPAAAHGGESNQEPPSGGQGADSGAAGGPEQGGTPGGCATGYPTVARGATAGSSLVCSASLARDRLSHALCSCRNLDVVGMASIDAYDSALGLGLSASGAAVGVNARYTTGDYLSVDGSLTLAGSTRLSLGGLTVSGDLKIAADATTVRAIRVGRDAWLGGSLSGLTEFEVGRDLHLAEDASLDRLLRDAIRGITLRDPVAITPPCRCDADPSFDLAASIEHARVHNDNALIGLSPTALSNPARKVDLALPCGRYFLTELGGSRDIRFRITGKVALLVAGDVSGAGALELDLDPGAELDWFVLGGLRLDSAAQVGDPSRAAALRIYVGGSTPIHLSGLHVAGNLYAPKADVEVAILGDFYGSILARDIASIGNFVVHYDRAVVSVGDACAGAALTACTGCGECGSGLTCVNGTCSSCTTDADCCDPLVCEAGRCQPLLGKLD